MWETSRFSSCWDWDNPRKEAPHPILSYTKQQKSSSPGWQDPDRQHRNLPAQQSEPAHGTIYSPRWSACSRTSSLCLGWGPCLYGWWQDGPLNQGGLSSTGGHKSRVQSGPPWMWLPRLDREEIWTRLRAEGTRSCTTSQSISTGTMASTAWMSANVLRTAMKLLTT